MWLCFSTSFKNTDSLMFTLWNVWKVISDQSPAERTTFSLQNRVCSTLWQFKKHKSGSSNQTMPSEAKALFLWTGESKHNWDAKLSRAPEHVSLRCYTFSVPLSKSSSRDNVCKMIWPGLLSKHWQVQTLHVVTSWFINSSYITESRGDQRSRVSVNVRTQDGRKKCNRS